MGFGGALVLFYSQIRIRQWVDGMDRLVEKTKKLGWSQQLVNLEVVLEAEEKSKLILLGKVLSNKIFSRAVVQEIISKAWNTIKEVEVVAIDKNIFLFTFNHEVDVRKVWDRRPWSFKGDHVILKKCDAEWSLNEVDFSVSDFWVQVHGLPLNRQDDTNLKKIGRIMGRVLEVDLAGNGWRRFVRVRVGIDINQPLRTGFPLYRKKLPALWIPFKFEKLGNFCYGCGLLGHDSRECPDGDSHKLGKEGEMERIYGSWLRAENSEFQPGIDLEELQCSDLAECNSGIVKGALSNTEEAEASGEGRKLDQSAQTSQNQAVTIVLDACNELEQREQMDQSENLEVEATVERVGGMEAANSGLETDEMICDRGMSLLLENDNAPIRLGNEDLVIKKLDLSVGPTFGQLGSTDVLVAVGPGLDSIFGPFLNKDVLNKPDSAREAFLGLVCAKRKAKLDELEEHIVKKARAESTQMSNKYGPGQRIILKAAAKGGRKGASIKKLVRSKDEKGKGEYSFKPNLLFEKELSVPPPLGDFSQSLSIQMAEEAGLIMPPPPP